MLVSTQIASDMTRCLTSCNLSRSQHLRTSQSSTLIPTTKTHNYPPSTAGPFGHSVGFTLSFAQSQVQVSVLLERDEERQQGRGGRHGDAARGRRRQRLQNQGNAKVGLLLILGLKCNDNEESGAINLPL